MLKILFAIVLLLLFLFAFGLAFYYFLLLEKQYKKRKLIQRLSQEQSSSSKIFESPVPSYCSTSNETPNSTHKGDKQTESESKWPIGQNLMKSIEMNIKTIPDFNMKLKFASSEGTDETNDLKAPSTTESSVKRKVLPTINYAEPPKLPSSFFSQRRPSYMSAVAPKTDAENLTQREAILKRTETEEILFTVKENMPSTTPSP